MAKATEIPSKFKNGWLDQLDGRTGIAQIMQQRYEELSRDLGGIDKLSYQQRSLMERALWLEYFLAQQEQQLATGQEFDANRWIQATNSLLGLYGRLGLTRVKHAVDISDYIKTKAVS
ncbi:hypothetical protein [Thiomicrospira sp. ALE5]|uniref:hypothetical protein n=1 Tax=Thiomicrospira sp. ALE5 TaxID=748650 RepID=UPI0008DF17AA|nr:hypothetical protein [Thiomicrospira sp. ALE5]SFR50842.1 hypothetical protein SAMN03092900_0422 [Thiomicrospira sp. ALE5]